MTHRPDSAHQVQPAGCLLTSLRCLGSTLQMVANPSVLPSSEARGKGPAAGAGRKVMDHTRKLQLHCQLLLKQVAAGGLVGRKPQHPER